MSAAMQNCVLTYAKSPHIQPSWGIAIRFKANSYTSIDTTSIDTPKLYYMLYLIGNWSQRVPKGPQGQKRPAGTVECAVMVAKIATGEIADEVDQRSVGKIRSGKAGGKARAERLTSDERRDVARKAAAARWGSTHRSG